MDPARLDQACPISKSDLQEVLQNIPRFTAEKRRESILTWPDDLPTTAGISKLFVRERTAIDGEARFTQGADELATEHLSSIDQLERCGWEFFRVRESAFYSNKARALQALWRTLEERKSSREGSMPM